MKTQPYFTQKPNPNKALRSASWRFFLHIFFLLLPLRASAESALFEEGLAAYQQGDLANSVSSWEELSRNESKVPALWYNLGNAYLQQGFWGRAIVAYERALWLDGSAEDVRENLTLARRKASEAVSRPLRGEPIQAPIVSEAAAQQTMLVGVFLFWLSLGFYLVRRLRQGIQQQYLTVAVLGLLIAGIGAFWSWQAEVPRGRAIVIRKEAQVHRGAIETSELVYSLGEGDSVLVEEHRAGWARVRGPQLAEGWVRESELEAPFAGW
jgi:tetratricopeptide (TPR) repeat protein